MLDKKSVGRPETKERFHMHEIISSENILRNSAQTLPSVVPAFQN